MQAQFFVEDFNYVHGTVVCSDASGALVDPDGLPTGIFYKVSQSSGALESCGGFFLYLMAENTGFFSAIFSVSTFEPGVYLALITATIDGIDVGSIAHFVILPAIGYSIQAAGGYASGTLTIVAALECKGQTVAADGACTITVFDAAANQLFVINDADADANGVFKATKDSPGLTAGNAYCAKIAIAHSGQTRTRTIFFTAR